MRVVLKMESLQLEKAVSILQQSEVVVIPTETVYGLAADATNDAAVARIYEIKGRPTFNPLIIHVNNLKKAAEIGQFSNDAIKLADAFWAPGKENHRPLTIIVDLQKSSCISKLATAGLNTVGIRVPNCALTNELLALYPNPLAAPSANISQGISTTNAENVMKSLGNAAPMILDGGQCKFGVESTIIDMTANKGIILRYGGTTPEELKKVLGYMPQSSNCNTIIKAPGMMERHYAPSITLKTNIEKVENATGNVAFLGFGKTSKNCTLNLSQNGDLREAAANLFKMLFQLDDPTKYEEICVAPIPMEGLGIAINDRLRRAATN
jgi:L-threonylcarbamoyladenylate synthase